MNRNALALAVLGTAALGCSVDLDSTDTSESDLSSFLDAEPGGGCVSSDPMRSGFVRVRLAEEADDFATLEHYDATTGLLSETALVRVKHIGASELELHYLDSTPGPPIVAFRVKLGANGAATIAPGTDPLAASPARCDLRTGAPSLKLPVRQKPAPATSVTALPRVTDRGGAYCLASRRVNGALLHIKFEREYDGRTGVYERMASAWVYGPRGLVIGKDFFSGEEAKLLRDDDAFLLARTEGGAMKRFGEIQVKSRSLVFRPKDPALAAAIGPEVPVKCSL